MNWKNGNLNSTKVVLFNSNPLINEVLRKSNWKSIFVHSDKTDGGKVLAISKAFANQDDYVKVIRTLTIILPDANAYKLAGTSSRFWLMKLP